MSADWVGPPAEGWPRRAGALTSTRTAPLGPARPGYGWNLAQHVGDDPAAVDEHRRSLGELTGVARIQWLDQVHGRHCIEATSDTASQVPQADAAWTAVPGLGVAVLTADCVPVVLADRAGTVVGVAHGGWRGLAAGVLESLTASMPVAAAELTAWIGPAIGPDAYEVGDDVADAVAGLPDGFGTAQSCLRPGAVRGKHQLDLFSLTTALLERAGVVDVHCDRLCTYHDERFFSYRREGRTGRMVTLAWLRPGRG